MPKGYKVEYAWWEWEADPLKNGKKYFKTHDEAETFFTYILRDRHYYCARIVPIG